MKKKRKREGGNRGDSEMEKGGREIGREGIQSKRGGMRKSEQRVCSRKE